MPLYGQLHAAERQLHAAASYITFMKTPARAVANAAA